MPIDSYYTKGAKHKYNQDFALHNHEAACLVDGCSGGINTQIGVPILTQSRLYNTNENWLEKAVEASVALRLSWRSLLGTSMFFRVVDEHFINGEIWGDGGYLVEYKSGEIVTKVFSYEQGAAYYPIYSFYKNEEENWLKEFPENHFHIHRKGTYDDLNDEKYHNKMVVNVFEYNDDVAKIMMFSDGVSTFEGVDPHDVMLACAKIPNKNGVFLERQIKNKIIKDFGLPDDDFSCIAYIQ